MVPTWRRTGGPVGTEMRSDLYGLPGKDSDKWYSEFAWDISLTSTLFLGVKRPSL